MRSSQRWILVLVAALLILTAGCGEGPPQVPTPESAAPAADTAAEVPPTRTAEAPAAGTGSLRGRVVFEGEPPPAQKLKITKDTTVCAEMDHYDQSLVVGEEKGIRYAVVSLQEVIGGKPVAALGSDFVLNQEGCSYEPHVLVVPVHTPLKILNSDGILHNIHTYSTMNKPVNLAQPKYRKELETSFAQAERVSVKCDVHGWMSAWIHVVDHPYHVVTGENGSFSLEEIPAGTYEVTCWQESLGEQKSTVTIAPDAVAELDFDYSQ